MYISDMHTHSAASGHGTTCTIAGMAAKASSKGLKLLGITDHGPATPGSGTPSYFRSLSYAPRERSGISVFYGIELNILDSEGHVDLAEDILENLDYAVVSMHSANYTTRGNKEDTNAFLQAMQLSKVRILGHTDSTHYDLDYEKLAREAVKTGTIFEINEASLLPGGYRGDTRENCRAILSWCRKLDLPVILSSDSHGPERIGDFTDASAFLHEQLFPEELILNNQLKRLKAFLLEGIL